MGKVGQERGPAADSLQSVPSRNLWCMSSLAVLVSSRGSGGSLGTSQGGPSLAATCGSKGLGAEMGRSLA